MWQKQQKIKQLDREDVDFKVMSLLCRDTLYSPLLSLKMPQRFSLKV